MERKDKINRIESFVQDLEDIRDKAVTDALPGVVDLETLEYVSASIDDAINELTRSLEDLENGG